MNAPRAILFLAFILAPIVVQAQFNPTLFASNVSISISPQYPAPGDTVTLVAKGGGLDLSQSEIAWWGNGKNIAQGIGADTASIVAGALGNATSIELNVLPPDGSLRTVRATIIPTEIDLLVASDSYTPPFYRGRGIATIGTNILVQSIPRFKRPSGGFVSASDIIYTWKLNGDVVPGASGRGKSTARILVQHLYGGNTVSLEAHTSDETLSGAASISLPSVEPVLRLYEDHPLYGLMYHQAFGASSFVPETEMTFAAVPYFAQARSANDPDLAYAWRVNDTRVSSSETSPSELTINAKNSSGQALIGLDISHARNFYMDLQGSWAVTLSSTEGSAVDQFHTTGQ